MRLLGFTLACALIWVALEGDFQGSRFLMGLLIGLVLVTMEQSRLRRTNIWRKIFAAVYILFLFLFEIVYANWEQLKIVLAPKVRVEPHWIQYPMQLQTPHFQAMLAAMITLTPGTCSVDVDPGRRIIWVHALNAADAPATIARIHDRLEKPLLSLEET